METQELYARRAEIVTAATELLELPEMSDEDVAKFDELMTEDAAIKTKIDRAEKLKAMSAELSQRIDIRAGRENISADEAADRGDQEKQAFYRWIQGGMANLGADDHAFMAARRSADPRMAQSVGTDSAGGYTVPEGFQTQIEQAMLSFGGMREAATVFSTATGNDLPWPTTNDTAQEGEIIGENTTANEQDVTFGQVTLNAYKYSSKLIRIPMELLQDSEITPSVEGLITGMLGERIARITNRHFTVGTGTAQPNGIVTASAAGKTAAAVAAIVYDELIDLEHSIDPAYRMGARWMFHDTTLSILRKLKDGDGRPLWQPSLVEGTADRINGYPYTINQHMVAPAASVKAVLFGQLSKYMIRDVMGVLMVRLNERYAELAQVGLLGWSRHDGELIDAGTNPVKHLVMAAS